MSYVAPLDAWGEQWQWYDVLHGRSDYNKRAASLTVPCRTQHYEPPLEKTGLKLSLDASASKTLTWNATTTVSCNVDPTSGSNKLYVGCKIRLVADAQKHPWFFVIAIDAQAKTVTIYNPEKRTIPTGAGESEILLKGSGVRIYWVGVASSDGLSTSYGGLGTGPIHPALRLWNKDIPAKRDLPQTDGVWAWDGTVNVTTTDKQDVVIGSVISISGYPSSYKVADITGIGPWTVVLDNPYDVIIPHSNNYPGATTLRAPTPPALGNAYDGTTEELMGGCVVVGGDVGRNPWNINPKLENRWTTEADIVDTEWEIPIAGVYWPAANDIASRYGRPYTPSERAQVIPMLDAGGFAKLRKWAGSAFAPMDVIRFDPQWIESEEAFGANTLAVGGWYKILAVVPAGVTIPEVGTFPFDSIVVSFPSNKLLPNITGGGTSSITLRGRFKGSIPHSTNIFAQASQVSGSIIGIEAYLQSPAVFDPDEADIYLTDLLEMSSYQNENVPDEVFNVEKLLKKAHKEMERKGISVVLRATYPNLTGAGGFNMKDAKDTTLMDDKGKTYYRAGFAPTDYNPYLADLSVFVPDTEKTTQVKENNLVASGVTILFVNYPYFHPSTVQVLFTPIKYSNIDIGLGTGNVAGYNQLAQGNWGTGDFSYCYNNKGTPHLFYDTNRTSLPGLNHQLGVFDAAGEGMYGCEILALGVEAYKRKNGSRPSVNTLRRYVLKNCVKGLLPPTTEYTFRDDEGVYLKKDGTAKQPTMTAFNDGDPHPESGLTWHTAGTTHTLSPAFQPTRGPVVKWIYDAQQKFGQQEKWWAGHGFPNVRSMIDSIIAGDED